MKQEARLCVEDLATGYGQSRVISGLSLTVPAGQIVTVMGLNGMGKTTLMKALIGILPITSGKVWLGGEDLTDKQPFERVRAGLAYVPQGRHVFGRLTVEENIQAGLSVDSAKVPDQLYHLFPVLQQMRKRRSANLSGGQQQQLVISRALASNPRVLLLDEPTEGIQPSIIKELAGVLRSIRAERGLSIVVCEQVLSFALAVADRVVVLNRGDVVHDSPRAELDESRLGALLSLSAPAARSGPVQHQAMDATDGPPRASAQGSVTIQR